MARFRHGNKKRLMTLAVDEFLRRFLLHVLPPGFVRIRNFGFLANRNRATLLPLCFRLLGNSEKMAAPPASPSTDQTDPVWNCPVCGGTMHVVERLSAAQLLLRLATSTRPIRCMKPYPHPRPLSVLRRACGSLVSSGQNLLDDSLSSVHKRPRRANMLLHPALQPSDAAQHTLCLIPLHLFRPIQST